MFAIIFALWVFVAHGQTLLTQRGDMVEMVDDGTDPALVHRSANIFAEQVGKMLKAKFIAGQPSRVLDPDVELRVYTVDDTTRYRLTWSCRIVATTEDKADWYFDRRGTLLWGKTRDAAITNVARENAVSNKGAGLRAIFPAGVMPLTFVVTSTSGSSTEGYWAITEYFLAAPRPK